MCQTIHFGYSTIFNVKLADCACLLGMSNCRNAIIITSTNKPLTSVLLYLGPWCLAAQPQEDNTQTP